VETIALLYLLKNYMLFAILLPTWQKSCSSRAGYSFIAKSIQFLTKLQQHRKKHTAFEQVTTPLQNAYNFLSKLQQHCKKRIVFEQVTTTLQKAYSF